MGESLRGKIGFAWGVGGVLALLVFAVYRLLPIALAPLEGDLSPMYVVAYAVSVLVMAYSEGYRAFQKGFSPRVVARALYVSRAARGLRLVLAPAFCMGLFEAERRRLIVSWCTTLGVLCLVIVVGRLEQPWRGIIDAGVVAGLSWGIVATTWFAIRGVVGDPPVVPAEVPATAT